MEKTYTLSDGTKFIFEYDHNRMGIITLECMDTLMSLLKATAEQTEPKPCEWCKFFDGENCFSQEPCKVMLYFKTEPQTEMEKSGSRAVQTARCLNCHNAKACKENHWEVCRYEPWKLTAVEDEPQTDCSWQKGE